MWFKKAHFSPPTTPSARAPAGGKPFDFVDEERRNKRLAVAGLVIVQTLFSLGTVFVKWTLKFTPVTPIIFLLYREFSAAVILVALSSRYGEPPPSPSSRTPSLAD